MKVRRSFFKVALVAGVAIIASVSGLTFAADPYPVKPIRVIIPFPAGGSTDVIGRAVVQKMAEVLGQSLVVENIGGASTMVGAERVAKSSPDGYTLLVASSTTFATNPLLICNAK